MQETVLFLKLEMATVVLLIKSMISDQKVQDLRFVRGFEDACVGNGHDISSRLLTPIHLFVRVGRRYKFPKYSEGM